MPRVGREFGLTMRFEDRASIESGSVRCPFRWLAGSLLLFFLSFLLSLSQSSILPFLLSVLILTLERTHTGVHSAVVSSRGRIVSRSVDESVDKSVGIRSVRDWKHGKLDSPARVAKVTRSLRERANRSPRLCVSESVRIASLSR